MTSAATSWTAKQAYVMAILCLLAGIVLGYLVHGPAVAAPEQNAAVARPPVASAPASVALPVSNQQAAPAEMEAAGTQAATPVLERLKSNPKDFKLLVTAGEMYYRHGDYADAAGYYVRALAVQDNFAVRNQYASALFYQGDADGALQQYAKVLKTHPTNDVALFNSGMIKFTAKRNAKGAIELWQKLLQAYPNHPQRDRVQKMIERASQSTG